MSLPGVDLVRSKDILPASTAKTVLTPKGSKLIAGQWWQPLYCANCGKHCGRVPEDSGHAFYLCDPCFRVHGTVAGTMVVPDEVFWATVREAQLEKYGRELTTAEMAAQLTDPDSFLSKLARDRAALTPTAGG